MTKNSKNTMTATAPATRVRRTEEVRIAALEAQIAALKQRAEAKKVKRDPALKHVAAALRSIDKALDASEDKATRQALDEARATISAALSINGIATKGTLLPQRRRAGGSVDAAALLAFVQKHPGLRGEQIAAELSTDSTSMRPVMKQLIASRQIRTKGERRGMTYTAA